MNKSINQLVSEIISLAIDVSKNTKTDVFVDYSGHTDQLDYYYYVNGWGDNKKSDTITIYLDTSFYNKTDIKTKLQQVLQTLQKLNNGEVE